MYADPPHVLPNQTRLRLSVLVNFEQVFSTDLANNTFKKNLFNSI